MMFTYISLSLIVPLVVFAHPVLDHEQHSPIDVRGAAAAPESPPLP